jgi:ElaB/YqjD/DUF883 family membrane-anchored ribosome-binding protein
MWAKFGQMTGKVISKIKKPKGLKQKAQAVMSKTKVQAKKMAGKTIGKTKEIIKNQYQFTKDNPGLSAAAIGAGAVVGSGIGYGINKMRKKNKKKEYKTTDLDLGKYSYKITSYK